MDFLQLMFNRILYIILVNIKNTKLQKSDPKKGHFPYIRLVELEIESRSTGSPIANLSMELLL